MSEPKNASEAKKVETKDADVPTAIPTEDPVEPPVEDHGIGLIKVDGTGLSYVGLAPAREKDPETPDGLKITSTNSTYQPIATVGFDRNFRIKDPKTGEFYSIGPKATGWGDVELNGSYLIPR